MNKKECLTNLYKYRIEILCSLLFLFMCLRLLSPIFAILAFIIATIGIIFEFDTKGLCYIGFIYSFRFIFRYKSDEIYLFVFIICVWILVMLINFFRDKKYLNKKFLTLGFLIIGFLIYSLIPRGSDYNIVNYMKTSLIILTVYFVLCYREQINLKKFTLIFVVSVLLSSILSLFTDKIETLHDLVGKFSSYDSVRRYTGLDRDPNFYSVSLLVPLATLMNFYLNNNLKWYIFFPLAVSLIVFGLLTLSKSFLLGFVIILILFMILVLKRNVKKGLIFDGCILVSLILLCIIFYDKIILIFNRFNIDSDDTTTINDITTGRLNIWKDYFNYFINNPIDFLFGNGFGERILEKSSHNTIIQGICSVGLIGIIYLTVLFVLFIIREIKENFNFSNYLPLIIFFILSMALDYFTSTSAICYLIMGLISINYKNENKDQNKNIICLIKEKRG